MPLSERKVVIIGGSAGMGRAVAEASVELGAHVIVASKSEDHLKEVADALPAVETKVIDVRDVRAMDYCLEEIGRIDHLVFSAADLTSTPFMEIDLAEAKRMFDVKFWGAFAAAQSAARFIPDDGSITLFSGIAARMPVRGLSVVSSINSAIEGLTRSLAVELGPIRVNAVSPGFVDTHGLDEERLRRLERTLPTRRVGTPRDVADAVLFLMQNPYMTGTILSIDGGRILM